MPASRDEAEQSPEHARENPALSEHRIELLLAPIAAVPRLAKQPVVLVEAREDRLRDPAGSVYAAASFGFFCESKNCASSVEPCNAVVEALPPVTICVIWSK